MIILVKDLIATNLIHIINYTLEPSYDLQKLYFKVMIGKHVKLWGKPPMVCGGWRFVVLLELAAGFVTVSLWGSVQ